jgi:hypothetical protein
MNIGMLWFDNDPKAGLEVKVERAAIFYRNKYGKNPSLCFVHPSMLPVAEASGHGSPSSSGDQAGEAKALQEGFVTGGIEIRPTRSVLPNHFWLGFNVAAEPAPAKP